MSVIDSTPQTDPQSFAITGLLELDGNQITIEYQEPVSSHEFLMIYCNLGQPYQISLALLSHLLQANYLYRGTGGATLGIERENGDLFLAYQPRLDGLSGSDFAAMLMQFNQIALYWREFIGHPMLDFNNKGENI